MNKLLALSTAALLTVSLSQASLAQGRGGGGGHGGGGGQGKHAEHGPDNGPGDDGQGGKGNGKGKGHGEAQVQVERGGGPGHGQGHADRGAGRVDPIDRQDRVVVRQAERRNGHVDRAFTPGAIVENRTVIISSPRQHGLIAGCPPGLAKKNNGCMPPGLVRQEARAQYYNLWGRPDDGYYRYNEGYLYRYDPRGGLLGYLPALGGALAVGNPWPVQYRYDPMPSYYSRYYGLDDPYDYRYADGALYGVDPRTNSIQQVVALLTGQPMQIGQRLPPGYDVYNVPYQYRSQYYDSPDRYYRYNDGYVYQVDPTTQLVQAIIQLLT